METPPSSFGTFTRRRLLQGIGLGTAGLALGACKGAEQPGGSDTLKIGFVSPRTGPAASFGEPDSYVLELARKKLAEGLTIGGTRYEVVVVDKDSQSNPQRSAQVANDLINSDGVDLMLTTSTPETVNPVSDACEAAGVPCISTVVPWQAWYFGRGAKEGQTDAYKYTFHFCFGVEQFHSAYTHLWPQVETNKKVAVMWPNDSDGNAIRASLGPMLEKSGYTIVDPGAYTNGSNDYSAQIAKFKAEGCEIFSTFPIPSDFATFWRQAAQQGFRPKIAQAAKTGLFPSQVEALGDIGAGVASAAYWTPTYPYTSSLTGVSSQALGDGYQQAAGKQWTQQLGPSLALFDVAAAALTAAGTPRDRDAVAAAIATLEVETPVGRLKWGAGPNRNVVSTPILGGQWVPGSGAYPLDFVLCENSSDPNVPVAGQLKRFGTLT
ncbi:ABC transporter substrate-binding protein [Actinoplanes capillaceus]|uniref:ABC transporter substrate-binding protein n=1 Tax=Actinoplanes campanulatus TaxID=113559 RepID=A0ABQ3WVD7_9ACTN|nr:ABC transporter substrate-binding protein [Actinoplanes capillaceus]GID50260.1 ABC transporter substrate-binding protein [Actinoplanes capillaceus]